MTKEIDRLDLQGALKQKAQVFFDREQKRQGALQERVSICREGIDGTVTDVLHQAKWGRQVFKDNEDAFNLRKTGYPKATKNLFEEPVFDEDQDLLANIYSERQIAS